MQVHNNKHPPTQKKFKDQAMLIKFQWNFLSLKNQEVLINLKIKNMQFYKLKFYNFSAPTKN